MNSQRGVKTPVDLLASYCESHHLSPPNYQFVRSNTSQLRAPRFFCNVQVGGNAYDTASDFACQSDAKQAAARVVLNSMNGNVEGQSSEAKRPEGDFRSVWGNLWMPYWTNYEILMERFRFLGGFTWTYVLNEIAKGSFNLLPFPLVNNLPVPLKFTFKGSDGAFIAQLSFLGRTFTSTCPKETDRDAKQEVSKLIVLSLLGRNKGRDAVQPTRGFVDFRTNSSVRVASPQVWEAGLTKVTGVTGTDAGANAGRMLYAEVAKLKNSVVETAVDVAQQGADEEKVDNSPRISSSPDIFDHHYSPISRPSHPVLSGSISPSLAESSQAICHPSHSIPVSAHDFLTPFKITTSRIDGAFHVNTQPANQVCSIFDSLTTQLEALHLPHHVSEAAQPITALNFSSGSLASSSYDQYHQNAAQSISADEQTYRIDAESVANLQMRLIASSSPGSRDTLCFPQIPAPPELAPSPSFLDTKLHIHGDSLGLHRLAPLQLPQVISTPHPPIFTQQVHSHPPPTWPPAHDAAAMQHSHSHPLPMHHSSFTFSHSPPYPPYPPASGFSSASPIHSLLAYDLGANSRVPSSMPLQTYTSHLAGFSPFQAPQFQNAALSGTQHAPGPQQTPQQPPVHSATATESPSLRLARLLRVNYPYLPSPQYSQQQTITGEMVATVAVGSLGTFVSRRRNGGGRGIGGLVGIGEQEVAVGDLMEGEHGLSLV
ncbi:hypothetical protein BC937DRAFT_89537, partial [Endogone sp. FLAS-F59071]